MSPQTKETEKTKEEHEPKNLPESLFILQVQSGEMSRPMTMEKLDEFVKANNLGGTVYFCSLAKLGEVRVQVEVPWRELLGGDEPDTGSE